MSPREPTQAPGAPAAAPEHKGAADRLLAQRAVRGEEGAIDALLVRMECLPKLLAVQNNRMGRPLGPHELADLVQDTLVVAWSKLATFEGRGSLEAWVYHISRYQLLGAIKRKARGPRLLEDMSNPAPVTAAAPERDMGDSETLHEALDSLRAEESEVLRCKHMDQLSFEEIAVRLSVSPNTAKSRYYRGLRKLNELLRRKGVEEPGT